MEKIFEINYKGHQIKVINTWFSGEKLYIDGELQDQQLGTGSRSRLFGQIRSGSGAGERIKVSLGAVFTVECRIFADDSLVYPQFLA